jgi:hypothetical protein
MTSFEAPAGTRGTKMDAADAIVAMAYANPELPLITIANIVNNLYRAGYIIARPDPVAVSRG